MKEIEEDINRWKDIPCSWIEKNQYCQNDYTTQTIYRFKAIPIKLPMAFFTELEQKKSQYFYGDTQKNLNRQNNLWEKKTKNKTGAGGIRLPDFRLE